VVQDNAELDQVQVEDWEDESFEDKAAEEEELARVQQDIERGSVKSKKPSQEGRQ
jgi:hypothetical protein